MKSKFVTFLLSVAIAFGIWAYVATVQAPESEKTYYNVPVVLGGQSILDARDLMIVSHKEFKINLTLSGYRTDLNKLDSTNITVLADLSQITTPGTHTLNYSVSYPGSVQFGNIHTVNQDPQQITIEVVEHSTKDIPVNVSCIGSVPTGYTADRQNVLLDHNTITISGPKTVIDRIHQAKLTVDLTNQYQTFTKTISYVLCDRNGEPVLDVQDVSRNVSSVQATVKILKLKEVPLKVHVIPGGGITEEMVTITLERPSIMVSGSEAALENLTEITLGNVDLGSLTESTSLSFTISLPDGVNNVTGVTSISAQVEMPAMQTRTFKVARFEALHVPEGMEINFLTELLEVQVRGPAVILDTLTADAIVAVVDFVNAQPGSESYTAIIEIRNAQGVGAVGTYKVAAEVVPVLETPEE